jgi:hypothetical protein
MTDVIAKAEAVLKDEVYGVFLFHGCYSADELVSLFWKEKDANDYAATQQGNDHGGCIVKPLEIK